MKNLIFLFSFLIIASSTIGQRPAPANNTVPNGKQERLIADFAYQINEIKNSKAKTQVKTLRIDKVISEYQRTMQSFQNEILVSEYVKEISRRPAIDESLLTSYLDAMAKAYPGRTEVPMSFVHSLGNVKTDQSLRAALELYQMIGDGLAGGDLCKIARCDFTDTKEPKSRGADASAWVYTGEKTFVHNREYSGYLYYCQLIPNFKRTKPTLDAKPSEKPSDSDLVFAWKKEEDVDVWRNDL